MTFITKQGYKELLDKTVELQKCQVLICKLQNQLKEKSINIKQLQKQVSYCKRAHSANISIKENSSEQDNSKKSKKVEKSQSSLFSPCINFWWINFTFSEFQTYRDIGVSSIWPII